jgi:hypothetical protein
VANVSVSAHRYVGLRPFGARDRRLFFGRTAEAVELAERWSAEPFTVLYGPAGVGKTSLLRAAAVPWVGAAGGGRRTVLPLGRIAAPGAAGAANPLVAGLLGSWAPAQPRADLVGLSVADFLARSVSAAGASGTPSVFAAVDQFEAAFGDGVSEPHRLDLIDQLSDAVRRVSGVHLLVSVREDRAGELAGLERRLGRAGRYRLEPLDADAALEAVTGPLHDTGRPYAPGVAEEVVHNLRTSRIVDVLGGSREMVADAVEPVQLQAVCSALWRALRAGRKGTGSVGMGHLYGAGDIDGALVRFCERAVREVATAQGVPEGELWIWLARTFVTDLGTRGAAYEGVAGVGGMPREVAGQLVDRHVLTAEHRLGSRWYLLPNDRLIAPVREAASRWDAGDAAAGGTDPGASLAAAEGALAAGDLALSARRAAEAVRTSGGQDLHTRASAISCLGQVAARGGHDREAESHYRAAAVLFEVMQDQAGTGRLLAELGRILLRRGRYADAVAQLQGAEARLPGDLAVQVDLARALRRSGQLWAATAVLGAALTIAPDTVDALVERGLIRIETREFSYALDDLDNAVRLRPDVGQQADIRSARAFARAYLGRTA